jgi:hypothetical protein
MKITQIIPTHKDVLTENITQLVSLKNFPLTVFDPLVTRFLNDLSLRINKNPISRKFPALISLAFWLRKGNIDKITNNFSHLFTNKNLFASPTGWVFHIAPTNVDTMFFYSLTTSLLAGNKNLVRLSKKATSEQINLLLQFLKEELHEVKYKAINEYVYVFQYEHDNATNQLFSILSDGRIIWGGDNTIKMFKQYTVKPFCKDLVFPDRLSFSIIVSKKYLELDKDSLTILHNNLYNDSYTFDQKGCSSPQILFFLGSNEENKKVIKDLYYSVNKIVKSQYKNDIYSIANIKYLKANNDVLDNLTDAVLRDSNYIYFTAFNGDLLTLDTCGTGYFYYRHINKLEELYPFIFEKVQTLSYFGLSEDDISELKINTTCKGVDRIVPIGKSLAFDYIWDGYNIIDELIKKKTIL